jgi:peptide/nickel transport system permease protein
VIVMTGYLIRRILILIPTVFIVSVMVFILMHMMPGNAFEALILNPKLKDAAAVIANKEKLYGLNLPWPQQYWNWIVNMFHGNFGTDFINQTPVSQELAIDAPRTFRLAIAAEVVILVIGVPMGLYMAAKVNRPFDTVSNFIAMVLYSFPGFVFAMFLILFFAYDLNWLPAGQSVSTTGPNGLLDHLRHMVLPVLALSLPSIAGYMRLTRSNVLQVLYMDFNRTARAKGLRNRTIMFRHVLRNAMIPLLTQLGFDIGGLLGGAVIIEEIFQYPGMGMLTVGAAIARNYPIILATTLLFAISVVVGNLIADILLAITDPRVRFN